MVWRPRSLRCTIRVAQVHRLQALRDVGHDLITKFQGLYGLLTMKFVKKTAHGVEAQDTEQLTDTTWHYSLTYT